VGASLAGEEKYAKAEPQVPAGYQRTVGRQDRIGAPDRYYLDLTHCAPRAA
jgi:hypothetical protein